MVPELTTCRGGQRMLGQGQEKEGQLSWCQDLTCRRGTVRFHMRSHSSSKAEMSSCEEGVPPGNVAMLTQFPQHIHMPAFVSFIVPNSRSKVLGRHMPLLLLLPPPLLLHRAVAGKKRGKSRFSLSSSSGIIILLPA